MHVLALSYGRNLFTPGVERQRQLACAAVVDSLHTIVFQRSGDESCKVEANFHLYPSGGRSKIGMLIGSYRTGAKLLSNRAASEDWVITTQDPFESGLIGYLLAKRFGVSLNIQEHGDFFSTPYWSQETFLNKLRLWFGGCLLKRADTVRVVSNRIKATLIKIGVPADRLRQLAVAVPLASFSPASVHGSAESAGRVTIMTVARFVSQKNLQLLLRAFVTVQAQYPEARLVLVGSGPDSVTLQASVKLLLAATSEAVTFVPWSDNVPALLRTADIYALSSNYEGYARVIPEAMATGLPIVMTDVGCAGELCIHEQHGLVVPVADELAFTSALKTLVASTPLRLQYGTAGLATVAQQRELLANYPADWRASLT